MMHIWLIGMMGTGKTSVGEHVATTLGMPFIDIDARIVTETGSTIGALFDEGEAVFRGLEASMIQRIAEGPASVVATGGGAVLDPENVAAMQVTGTTVLLTASPETLAARLGGDAVDRPLLREEGDLVQIAIARDATYRAAADVIIDTTGRDIHEVESEVIRCVDM